jgi:hypothetical protein
LVPGRTLTTVVGRANMRRSMVQRTSRRGRFVAWALALALAVVSSATCLLGAETTEAQRACCAAMNHDCGGMSVEQDCCAGESPNVASVTSSLPMSLLAPPVQVAVNIIAPRPEAIVLTFGSSALDAGAPKPSSRPTYLFVSVFRL